MRNTFFLLFVLSSVALAQKADFYKEDITFRLDNLYLQIEGYYWFSNNSGQPVENQIYYPFPYYAGAEIDSIRVYNLSAGRKNGFVGEGKYGISFPLHLAAYDTALFQIKYRHELTADSAVYILKTTQGWGKPLEQAEFKLITPDSFLIKKFSYPPDEIYMMEGYKIYRWKKQNFMPAEDMIFYF
jgi:hypothetical protein